MLEELRCAPKHVYSDFPDVVEYCQRKGWPVEAGSVEDGHSPVGLNDDPGLSLREPQRYEAEAPGDSPPAEVLADAYKAHYERIHDLLRQLEVGVTGVTGGVFAAWPQWLALRSDDAMRPFPDTMSQHLKGHGLAQQFKDAVFDGHLSALSNLYAQWENAHREGNEAAADRDRHAYDRAPEELTDIIKTARLRGSGPPPFGNLPRSLPFLPPYLKRRVCHHRIVPAYGARRRELSGAERV